MTSSPPRVIRLSGLTLDLTSGRLTGPAGDVPLRPKSFALLAHLACNAGSVVSKDAAMAAVWPDVVVTEDSLTQCVHDIRRALRPGAAHHLRTVPRRGYLFIADGDPDAAPDPGQRHLGPRHPGSVAVLPFLGPADAGLSDRLLFDGLANDVISRLAGQRSFRVIARGSTFALRHLAANPLQPAALLNVAFIVSGSFAPVATGYHLRIDLTRTSDGVVLGTGDIRLTAADILSSIDGLTDRITNRIAAEITADETRRALSLPDAPLTA